MTDYRKALIKIVLADHKAKTETTHPDTRRFVDRMFEDFNPTTGQRTPLEVRATYAGKENKLSEVEVEPNSIPLLLNFAGDVEDFSETNGLDKGENILIIGGIRQGKAGLGSRLFLPVSQAKDFCDRIMSIVEASEGEIPKLLETAKTDKKVA